MAQVVAIIRRPGYGNRDIGSPVLWFDTYINEHSAALQVLKGEDADRVIEESGVYDVHDLEGRACYVEVEANTIKFVRVWKP